MILKNFISGNWVHPGDYASSGMNYYNHYSVCFNTFKKIYIYIAF